jgi:hypothetical protein
VPPITVISWMGICVRKMSRMILRFKVTPSMTARIGSARLCSRVRPIEAPLASGFHRGLRSPSKYGRKMIPFAPGGDFSISTVDKIVGVQSHFGPERLLQDADLVLQP